MARLTEHLQDRPHDGPWFFDVAMTVALWVAFILGALAFLWFASVVGLQFDVVLAGAAVAIPLKHQPATPLPYSAKAIAAYWKGRVKTPQANDAEVKRRAAAYPKLVEALRNLLLIDQRPRTRDEAEAVAKQADALLRELGEAGDEIVQEPSLSEQREMGIR